MLCDTAKKKKKKRKFPINHQTFLSLFLFYNFMFSNSKYFLWKIFLHQAMPEALECISQKGIQKISRSAEWTSSHRVTCCLGRSILMFTSHVEVFVATLSELLFLAKFLNPSFQITHQTLSQIRGTLKEVCTSLESVFPGTCHVYRIKPGDRQ